MTTKRTLRSEYDTPLSEQVNKKQKYDENAKTIVEADLSEDSSDSEYMVSRQEHGQTTDQSLYLETVNRSRLDFDFEKICSVSLSNKNVYACLTCGKYFQGRGESSYAYFHSLDENHHVFINLNNLKIYILPEGYEVFSKALDDIKYVANPTYSKNEVSLLDSPTCSPSFDLDHQQYTPGYIGINNIKQLNDYANVVIQLLTHVKPLRNFFLLKSFPATSPEIIKRTSVLFRKIWNPKAFKAHVSPHDLLQYLSIISKRKFTSDTQSDPFDFLNWYMNKLHIGLGGSKSKPGTSIIQKIFQGSMVVKTRDLCDSDTSNKDSENTDKASVTSLPFMFLSLDLPPTPLFKSEDEQYTIPQVSLTSLLSKYDGNTEKEINGKSVKYELKTLPPYLIFHIKRFPKTPTPGNKSNINSKVEDFGKQERNPTVVSFNHQSLDMQPYVHGQDSPMLYRLIANIIYESNLSTGGSKKHTWKIQLLNKSTDTWIQIQDLVVTPIMSQLLFLSESYIQVWEKL